MMLNNQPVEIPHDYICPITQEIMEDPVVAADGQTYERAAIFRWLETGRRNSPLTGARLRHDTLTENIALRRVIQDYQERLPIIQRERQIRVDMDVAIELREQILLEYIRKKETNEKEDKDDIKRLEKEVVKRNQENQAMRKQITEGKEKEERVQKTLEEKIKSLEEENQRLRKQAKDGETYQEKMYELLEDIEEQRKQNRKLDKQMKTMNKGMIEMQEELEQRDKTIREQAEMIERLLKEKNEREQREQNEAKKGVFGSFFGLFQDSDEQKNSGTSNKWKVKFDLNLPSPPNGVDLPAKHLMGKY